MVIPHGQNKGYAEALRTGYRYALEQNYDGIVQIDADGQHDPEHIPELFYRGRSWDVLIGSRFLGRQRYRSPIAKAIGVRIFRHIIHNETGLTITDPTSGYRYMDRRAFTLCSKVKCDYPDANMIILMHKLGLTIGEMPVKMQPNAAGKSMHKGKAIRYMAEVFQSIMVNMKCRT
jgi:glycosyltransferase involved in cell wall biosynthesis